MVLGTKRRLMTDSTTRLLTVFPFALLLASSFPAQSHAQSDDTRKLTPRVYAQQLPGKIAKNRPPSKSPGSKPAVKYVPLPSDTAPVAGGVDVGVIFWRLREAQKADDQEVVEPTRIVKRVKGKEVESTVKMTPTRATSETVFADGEFIRLTIEVPFESYIYILNREQYVNNTMSDPYLVFPSEIDKDGSAKGVPGKLVYIPNRIDYFEITRLSADGPQKAAEVFTVLLTKGPLNELPPLKKDEERRKIDRQLFDRWERAWGGQLWRFEREGGVGTAITKVEKNAGKPDGELLTVADPEPQTVYHVTGKSGDILLFTVRARIRNQK